MSACRYEPQARRGYLRGGAYTRSVFRCEAGVGKAIPDGVEHVIENGTVLIVPAGARHNIINTGDGALKVNTLYAPPNHKDGTVHATKAEAQGDAEEFDGVTSE